jgi:hypothetical protein
MIMLEIWKRRMPWLRVRWRSAGVRGNIKPSSVKRYAVDLLEVILMIANQEFHSVGDI